MTDPGAMPAALAAIAAALSVVCVVLSLLYRSMLKQRDSANTALKGTDEQPRQEIERLRIEQQSAQIALSLAQAKAERVEELEGDLARLRATNEQNAASCERLKSQTERIPKLEEQVHELRSKLQESTNENSRLLAENRAQALSHDEKLAAITALRDEMQDKLKTIAQEALQANQNTFVQTANETFEQHRKAAEMDLDARRLAVEQLVKPLEKMLEEYKSGLTQMEVARTQATTALSTQIRQVNEAQQAVRAEASRLVMVLRSSPKTRGHWGEVALRRVLELAALTEHCDFHAEKTLANEDGRLRPDVVISLSGGRTLVVDAKAPLAGYLDTVDAVDEAERDRCLQRHAEHLKKHVQQLGSKAYYARLPQAPDYVVMFVPGENFYAAAAERDPDLFEFAASQGVIVATPATLIALAKSVAFGWRQEKLAEHARKAHDLGRELYKRLRTMGGHIGDLGEGLQKAITKYNSFIGSLEGSVLPQARKFQDLHVEGTKEDLAVLEPVQTEPRLLTPGRDMILVLSEEARTAVGSAQPIRPTPNGDDRITA